MVDRYRNYRPSYEQQPKKRHHPKRWLFLFTIIAIFLGGKALASRVNQKNDQKPVASTLQKPKPVIKANPIPNTTWNDLALKVNALISAQPTLDISVAVIDIGTNTKANYGIQNNFAGASTTKVLTAAAFLHEVEQGTHSLSEKVGDYTAKQQLQQMINQSNNDSWEALNTTLTYSKLEAYAHSLGISSYESSGNTITASDEALLLQKLYNGDLLNQTNTNLLLSFMQNTNNEDMIPKVIPSGATIYHKYGQLEDRLHDAAIVDYNGRPIALVIYTKGGATDGSNYTSHVALVQQLASTVFATIYGN